MEPIFSLSHIAILLFLLIVGVAAFGFWLWMLIDALQNPTLDSTGRLIWVLVIIFLHGLGAVIYFFVGRKTEPIT